MIIYIEIVMKSNITNFASHLFIWYAFMVDTLNQNVQIVYLFVVLQFPHLLQHVHSNQIVVYRFHRLVINIFHQFQVVFHVLVFNIVLFFEMFDKQ